MRTGNTSRSIRLSASRKYDDMAGTGRIAVAVRGWMREVFRKVAGRPWCHFRPLFDPEQCSHARHQQMCDGEDMALCAYDGKLTGHVCSRQEMAKPRRHACGSTYATTGAPVRLLRRPHGSPIRPIARASTHNRTWPTSAAFCGRTRFRATIRSLPMAACAKQLAWLMRAARYMICAQGDRDNYGSVAADRRTVRNRGTNSWSATKSMTVLASRLLTLVTSRKMKVVRGSAG